MQNVRMKARPSGIALENSAPVVASGRDVIRRPGMFDAQWFGHDARQHRALSSNLSIQ